MASLRSVGYFAIAEVEGSSGVYKKILGAIEGARAAGFEARLRLVAPGLGSAVRLLAAIAKAEEDIVVVRSNSYAMCLSALGMAIARLRGSRIVVDVPTPMKAVFWEIAQTPSSPLRKACKFIGWVLSGPWVYLPAHSVIQYGDDSWWLTLGTRRKTALLGNGIDLASVPMRSQAPAWPAETLRLVAVAQLAPHQGFDIALEAVSRLNSEGRLPFNLHLTIVGGGNDLERLKRFTVSLSAGKWVKFTGPLEGEQLMLEYANAHLAISSLGLHRKGLTSASSLKAREYCAIGIPFIAEGDDPDFPQTVPFRYQVQTVNGCEELMGALSAFAAQRLAPPCVIREYAKRHLDYKYKMSLILSHAQSQS